MPGIGRRRRLLEDGALARSKALPALPALGVAGFVRARLRRNLVL
jgi:hypothetical protein